jgi:hypothetical protein
LPPEGAVKQKLKEYALIAEIVGGIAIVLSLIFVGLQIKQNNELSLANSYRELLSDLNEVQSVMMTDENIHRVWLSFLNGEAETLSQSDYLRLRQTVGSLLRVYESAFYAFNYSQLGLSEWARMQGRIAHRQFERPVHVGGCDA